METKRYYPWWMQFIQRVTRLVERDPDDFHLAAWELLNGRLPPLPEHIVLSARLQSLSLRVLAHAISPTGKIAILMARDSYSCGLITWSQEEGLREQSQRELWNYTERLPLGIFFPDGCEEPLIYYGEDSEEGDLHHIRWGDFHHQIPAQPNIFEVIAWVEDGHRGLTYRMGGTYHFHRRYKLGDNFTWSGTNSTVSTIWMGCVDGRYAEILNQEEGQSLKWHGGKVAMPDTSHQIDEDTISHAYGGVQLVSLTEGHTHLWWSDGETTNSVCLQGVDITRKGGLLTSNQGQEVFIKDNLYPLSVTDAERIMIAPEGSKPPLQVSERDGTVCIEFMSTELDAQKRTIQYPLYGPYFPTLQVVEQHLLGFYLVTGTLHIIRYPII